MLARVVTKVVKEIISFIGEMFYSYVRFGRWVKRQVLALVKKPALINSIKYGVMLLLGIVVALSLVPLFPVPGNFRSLVVMSGSMEPAIHVGSVAVIKPQKEIKVGEIITFKHPRDPANLITHRVVEEKDGVFKTKGDANDAPDGWEIKKEDIEGKFLFSVPYLGYAVHFAQTLPGFILLVIVPAIFIILDELRVIKNELEKKYRREILNAKYAKNGDAKNAKILASLALLFGVTVFALGATRAYFSDRAVSQGNIFQAGTWGPSIVINEFMPDPSVVSDANGEWFEIYR